MSEEDIQSQRARFYSSMNYNEYVSVFDKPPSKPCLRPLIKKIEEDLNDFHLESAKNPAESSSNELPEIRKPSQSVNFIIGKNRGGESAVNQMLLEASSATTSSSISSETHPNVRTEQIEEATEEEEDIVESELNSLSSKHHADGTMNRNRSQSDSNHRSILEFLGSRSRKQSLAN